MYQAQAAGRTSAAANSGTAQITTLGYPARYAINRQSADTDQIGRWPLGERDICGMRATLATMVIAYALVKHGALGREVLA
jgi:hypothetical protein